MKNSDINKLIEKFPDKVPIIFNPSTQKTKKIDKQKFLVPRNLIMSELIYIIRKRIKLDPSESIFMFVEDKNNNKHIVSTNMIVSQAYENYKKQDNILYVTYANENTFG